jgi:sugar lactone lactonase YvrE
MRLAIITAAPLPMSVNGAPGDLYVTTGFNPGSIVRITPDGTKTTFATGLNGPWGVAFDGTGNLFETDNNGGLIYEFSPNGTKTTVASLDNVTGLAIDSSGNVYASDASFGNIYQYAPDGTRTTFATGTGHPEALAFDGSGNLFVASGHTILKVSPTGIKSTFTSALASASGLAFDSSGNLFAADQSAGAIFKFTPNGTMSTFASGLTNGGGYPTGLAFDRSGNLFVVGFTSNSILMFTPDGTQSTFVTGASSESSPAFEPGSATPPPTPTPTGTPTPTPTPTGTPTPTPTPSPRPATIGNISTRLQVGTADRVMIAGFIVQGSSPKKVLMRAAGPSLTQFGVPNALANPRLELHDTNNTIGLNDNWQATQIGGVVTSDQVAEIQNSGLAPRDPAESALIATLPPGSYTAIVQGVSGGTGVGIVEVYDLNATSGSLLANISTRGFVQTGDDAMIGGFIVVTQPTKVIIRAIAPSLTQFGVPDALGNPQLELHDSTSTIARNDDWQTTQIGGIITSDQVAEIQNSQLAPTNPAESAIIATLQPGSYTAIVRGVNTTTGNALVEVYSLQ